MLDPSKLIYAGLMLINLDQSVEVSFVMHDPLHTPITPICSSILFVGFGAMGQALLPLMLRHFNIKHVRVVAISPCEADAATAVQYGLKHINASITPDNLDQLLSSHIEKGGLILNVSVGVSSIDLIRWCQARGVLYIDTCIEPWPGQYGSPRNPSGFTNYALREEALRMHRRGAPTAVVAHGANPGIVTHFVKAGLIELAAHKNIESWTSWADLAYQLNIRVVQVAERDTQIASNCTFKSGAFYNTWSVDGFLAEALQYAELGWGTHEVSLPKDGNLHLFGGRSGIYLNRHSIYVQVLSWVPSVGEQQAYLITHHEALSITNLLTVLSEDGCINYRPTVYYAYHPSPMTCKSVEYWIDQGFADPSTKSVLKDDLTDGFDQLGILFVFQGGSYWYGSTLSLQEARAIAPNNNATTMQVAAGIIGAIEWMLNHPNEGVVEAESMNFNEILKIASLYLGDVSGVISNWQPKENTELRWDDFNIS